MEKDSRITIMTKNTAKQNKRYVKLVFRFCFAKGQWGNWENNSWTGMLGDLSREVKNLTVNFISLSPRRAQYFDISVPYYKEG